MTKEFNSHGIGLKHQHGLSFIVLEHQYGLRDALWKRSVLTTSHLKALRRWEGYILIDWKSGTELSAEKKNRNSGWMLRYYMEPEVKL